MDVTTYLEQLAKETHQAETEIIAQAIEIGLRQLWRDYVLARYLEGKISREEAIKHVGIEAVEIAEQQKQALLEDIAWAFDN